MSNTLMKFEENNDCHARILLTHLTGATDAGNAGGLAVGQLLASLPTKRVATFDSDSLIDYRAKRPQVTIENWAVTDIEMPEIALDLVQDDSGTPFLVLHGPEPDVKWKRFTKEIEQFAQKAGVEIIVSMTGMPAAVPHTRPTLVHLQSTDAELVEGQPEMSNDEIQFPASADTYLHHALSQHGMTDVRFLAAVPYYMNGLDFPRASLALLDRLESVLELNLPTGNLEAGTQIVDDRIKELAAETEEIEAVVEMLETHYDEEIIKTLKELSDLPSATELGLDQSPEPQLDTSPNIDGDSLARTIEQFLARTESTNNGDKKRNIKRYEPDSSRPRPRHRAPKPWEIANDIEDEDVTETNSADDNNGDAKDEGA